ncbi:16S rRNA (uracil(1498)-N(3))-methyltransferase [Mycoplasma marinum]|uniref:Ribosomal RNA small subunit methyltransferase E n=1 Tax=Mycoplasma marinum TaxID=1937190 RepID=A0A4R0XQ59_9MOLU|nr:16S rRNA (uracil(1498)-N(3))-methyltransferase [Mycoplasma marinum]TCG11705.1 16S rRNA (uracil(1498)-N(3))-methyltransferase [Mycoplasma marinum]
MFRFFVNNKIEETHFEISSETLKHMKVARISREKFICIFEGKFYICELENDMAKILEKLEEDHEHDGEVVIAAAIINTKRFEWMIQKAAELGATKIIPVLTKRVEQKLGNNISKKIERWNQIAKNACEQSFRNVPLTVTEPISFKEVLTIKIENKYIAHEKTKTAIKTSFKPKSLFLIGPEGGFTDEEVQLAENAKFENISLGKRILRAETASIYILSRIN